MANELKGIKEVIEEYADCRDEMDSLKVAVEIRELIQPSEGAQERKIEMRKKLEQELWAIKEAAWQLYANAFWVSGIPALVKSITSQVNTVLRSLGYDPIVLIR